MSVGSGTAPTDRKTADFVVTLVKLGFALAVVGGTTALVATYSPRAAWAIALIILLSVFVYQAGAVSQLQTLLDNLGFPNRSLTKKG